MRAGFLHQPRSVAHALFNRDVARKRHIRHQQRGATTPRHVAGVIRHLVHRDGHSGALALDDHPQGIADQNNLHARGFQQRRETGVVGGQHCEFFPVTFHFRQGGDGDRLASRLFLMSACESVVPDTWDARCGSRRLIRDGRSSSEFERICVECDLRLATLS